MATESGRPCLLALYRGAAVVLEEGENPLWQDCLVGVRVVLKSQWAELVGYGEPTRSCRPHLGMQVSPMAKKAPRPSSVCC